MVQLRTRAVPDVAEDDTRCEYDFDADDWEDDEPATGKGGRAKARRTVKRIEGRHLEHAQRLLDVWTFRGPPPAAVETLARNLLFDEAGLEALRAWFDRHKQERLRAVERLGAAPTPRDVVLKCTACGALRAASSELAASTAHSRFRTFTCDHVFGADGLPLSCADAAEFDDRDDADARTAGVEAARAAATGLLPNYRPRGGKKAPAEATLPEHLHQLPAFARLQAALKAHREQRLEPEDGAGDSACAGVAEEAAAEDAAPPALPPAPEAAGASAAASPSPLPRGAKKRAARAKWSAASVAALMAEASRQGLFLTSTTGATIRAAFERAGKLASGVRTTHLTTLLKAHRATVGCGARCASLARHRAADAPRACIRSALL